MMAKAVFDGFTYLHHLSLPLYKHIIGFPVDISDVEHVDAACKTLRQVVDIDERSVEDLVSILQQQSPASDQQR